MSSLSKACLELSNSIKGFRLSRSDPPPPPPPPPASKGEVVGLGVTGTISRAIKSATSRVRALDSRNGGPPPMPAPALQLLLPPPPSSAAARKPPPSVNLWQDEEFLSHFFLFFSPCERCVLAQVCSSWRDLLYSTRYWQGVTPVLHCRQWPRDQDPRLKFYRSLDLRSFDSIILFGATDWDVHDLLNNFAPSRKTLRSVALRCSNVTDAGMEALVEKMAGLYKLEMSGCNEITEAGLWASLNAKIVSLSISDCINIADDSVGAIAQLLPSLYELNLQAYHVTDAALSFFSAKQSYTLCVLRLQSCWELTNHGIVNVVHSLPNLSVLSLSGCSKITDDGVELIAENLRKLRSLDLSWCPRLTDAALEYIACDLGQLEELTLDRCCHITDIGVGYLSTMTCLLRLFLRWCTQLRDFGLQHLYTMKGLQVLSLAGCSLVTSSGLTGLIQLRACLQELELTNCPGATPDVCTYLRDNMPSCMIIE